MSLCKVIPLILCAGLFGVVFPPGASADEWNKATTITFNAPVEIPGKVLPAGTYLFKLFDSASDRNIVQVWDSNGMQLYATILAIPSYRQTLPDKTVTTFEERPTGSPEALKEWFYTGDAYGVEFVYPKNRAIELAKATRQNVLSMPSELAENITKPTKSTREPHVIAMESAPVTRVSPSGEEKEVEQAAPEQATRTEQARTEQAATPEQATNAEQSASTETAMTPVEAQEKLPKTDNSLPLVGLIGLASLGAASLFRRIAKRMA